MQPEGLQHAALQEGPVPGPGGELRVVQPLEHLVARVGEQVGRAVRASLQIEGDLPADHVAVHAELILVAQGGGQHVPGQFVLGAAPGGDLGDQLGPAGQGRGQEVRVEGGHGRGHLGVEFGRVAGRVHRGRAGAEHPGQLLQLFGGGVGGGRVDPGHHRGQVHDRAPPELDQVGRAGGQRPGEAPLDRAGHQVQLPPAEGPPAEQAVLDPAALLVGVAVQGDQRVRHDRAARVVQGLPQIVLAESVANVRVAAQHDAVARVGRQCTHLFRSLRRSGALALAPGGGHSPPSGVVMNIATMDR